LFKATIEDIIKMKDALTPINEIFDEVVFNVDSEGIKAMLVDRASVTMADIVFKSSLFKEYEVEGNVKICINMQEFFHSLKLFSGETTISLEGDHTLVLSQNKPDMKIIKIRLMDLEEKSFPKEQLQQLKFLSNIEMESAVLEKVVKESEKHYGGNLMFSVDENRLRVFGRSDMSEYDFRVEKNSGAIVKLQVKEPCMTSLNRDYIEKVVKATSISSIVRISMGNDFPLKLAYANDNISVTFYVAPTVETTLEKEFMEEKKSKKTVTTNGKKTIITDGEDE
jgi:proliferating cell nuclear antigen PCNA